jgi:hypothetical protein
VRAFCMVESAERLIGCCGRCCLWERFVWSKLKESKMVRIGGRNGASTCETKYGSVSQQCHEKQSGNSESCNSAHLIRIRVFNQIQRGRRYYNHDHILGQNRCS